MSYNFSDQKPVLSPTYTEGGLSSFAYTAADPLLPPQVQDLKPSSGFWLPASTPVQLRPAC